MSVTDLIILYKALPGYKLIKYKVFYEFALHKISNSMFYKFLFCLWRKDNFFNFRRSDDMFPLWKGRVKWDEFSQLRVMLWYITWFGITYLCRI